EVREETGLLVAARRLTGVYSSLRYRVVYPNGDQAQQVTFCYECEWTSGQPHAQESEVFDLRFFSPGELPPRPAWYADMLDHASTAPDAPAFDPPEHAPADTPYRSPLDLRPRVGTAPLIWPSAAAAVQDEAGRLRLQRRADNGAWGLPGGLLDTGETLAYT